MVDDAQHSRPSAGWALRQMVESGGGAAATPAARSSVLQRFKQVLSSQRRPTMLHAACPPQRPANWVPLGRARDA